VSKQTNYWVNGVGRGCCYQATNRHSLPQDVTLQYLLSNNDSANNNPFDEIPFNDTMSGYSKLLIDSACRTMNVIFYDQDNRALYQSSVPARRLSAVAETHDHPLSPAMVAVLTLAVFGTFVLVLCLYFYKWDSRSYRHETFRESESFMNYSPIQPSAFPGSLDTTRHEMEFVVQEKPLELSGYASKGDGSSRR